MPYVISNCSNNYGPKSVSRETVAAFYQQHPKWKSLACLWDGKFTRDWLYVVDHAKAIDLIFHKEEIEKPTILEVLMNGQISI